MAIRFSPDDSLGYCPNCDTTKDATEYSVTNIEGIYEYRTCIKCAADLIDRGNWDNPKSKISNWNDSISRARALVRCYQTKRKESIRAYGEMWRWNEEKIQQEINQGE